MTRLVQRSIHVVIGLTIITALEGAMVAAADHALGEETPTVTQRRPAGPSTIRRWTARTQFLSEDGKIKATPEIQPDRE
jgi:hypothetical protein